MEKAYVFLGGELKGSIKKYIRLIEKSPIYCGDGGANYLKEESVQPREIWGDMDSIDSKTLEKYRNRGVKINIFSSEKNFTDGELILDHLSKKYSEIVVIGALGGRIDHELTNINLLFKYKNVKFITENEEMFSVKDKQCLNYPKGTTTSFVPFSDEVKEVNLKGFKYSLKNYNLIRGDSRCMSNIIIEDGIVEYKSGKLLCVVQKKTEEIH